MCVSVIKWNIFYLHFCRRKWQVYVCQNIVNTHRGSTCSNCRPLSNGFELSYLILGIYKSNKALVKAFIISQYVLLVLPFILTRAIRKYCLGPSHLPSSLGFTSQLISNNFLHLKSQHDVLRYYIETIQSVCWRAL